MIVIAIIAIVASIGLVKFVPARIAANEEAAISTLRTILTAQQSLQSQAMVDTDADGTGEYAFLGELAGSRPIRVYGGPGNPPAIGVAPDDVLRPGAVPGAFSDLLVDGAGDGCVELSGYFFKVFVAGNDVGGTPQARSEDTLGGVVAGDLATWDSDHAERYFCAYAWPVQYGSTGRRAFFINEVGEVAAHHNRARTYERLANPPDWSAAYELSVGGARMDARIGFAGMGLSSNDGLEWTPVGQ